MPSLPSPIASGRTADIYPWPDGRVLKLIKPGFAPFLADQEALGARIAYQATGLAPQPGEIIEVDGRRGVLLEGLEDWIAIHAALHLEADNRAEWPLWEQAARAWGGICLKMWGPSNKDGPLGRWGM